VHTAGADTRRAQPVLLRLPIWAVVSDSSAAAHPCDRVQVWPAGVRILRWRAVGVQASATSFGSWSALN